jgi:hypothetical protein
MLIDVKSTILSNPKTARKYINEVIQDDLNLLKENKFRIPISLRTQISNDSNDFIVNITEKISTPYEMMLGAIWANKFGIKVGDSLSDILSKGEEFFYSKFSENYNTKVNEQYYDFYLTSSDGNHLHVMFDNDINNELIARLATSGKLDFLNVMTYNDGSD